jgi:hypothetical protein
VISAASAVMSLFWLRSNSTPRVVGQFDVLADLTPGSIQVLFPPI